MVSPSAASKSSKRKASEELPAAKKTPRAKKTKSFDKSTVIPPISDAFIPPPPPPLQNEFKENTLVPAVLTFSFEDAKAHLIRADHRFEDVFTKLRCKPFEFLEQVHPFRALVESILA
jgi:DNA-3-methyladenine glycosylase II